MNRHLTLVNNYKFISGAHKYINWTLEKQVSLGHEVYLISYHESESKDISYKEEILEHGIRLISIYKKRRPTDKLNLLMKDEEEVLLDIFWKIGFFDSISLNIWDSPMSLGISKVCSRYTNNLFLTEHTYYSICLKKWLCDDQNDICSLNNLPKKCGSCSAYEGLGPQINKSNHYVAKLRYKYTYFLLKNYVNTILCPSESLKKDIQKSFPKIQGKVKKINIEDAVETKASLQQKTNFKYLFGFIGRLDKHKGISEFHECLNNLEGDNFSVLYAISTKKETDTFAPESHYKYSVIKNMKYKNVYEQFYSQVEYVVFPSIWKENYPLVCIESKKFNKKIIAHGLGGVPEILRTYKKAFIYNDKDTFNSILENIVKKSS